MVDNETEAADFLERLDINVDDLESRAVFDKRLDEIFSNTPTGFATREQHNVLFDAANTKFLEFPENGIRRIGFTRLGRSVERFTIAGRRGLFNFASALKFLGR